jgi:hypothetical protein
VRAGIFSPTTCEALPLLHSRMDRRPSMIALNVTFVPMTLPLRSFTLVRYGPWGTDMRYIHIVLKFLSVTKTAPAAHVHRGNHPAPNTSGATVTLNFICRVYVGPDRAHGGRRNLQPTLYAPGRYPSLNRRITQNACLERCSRSKRSRTWRKHAWEDCEDVPMHARQREALTLSGPMVSA